MIFASRTLDVLSLYASFNKVKFPRYNSQPKPPETVRIYSFYFSPIKFLSPPNCPFECSGHQALKSDKKL